MDKILIIGTGGTIACEKGDSIHLDKPFKILDYVERSNVEFECASPYSILSENLDFEHIKMLVDFIKGVDFCKYKGVIILHGSDSLSYAAAVVANAFYGKPIVLVASDRPLEDSSANGVKNFNKAVDTILSGISSTFVSYNELTKIDAIDGKADLENKNVLIISPYPSVCYENYDLSRVDAVLHTMYHSATCPKAVHDFIAKCKSMNIPFFFVTENSSADYETAKDFENIIFNSTVENAYAGIILNLI